MFDSIVVFRNNQSVGPPIDKGMLAETLLFYGNIHLLLNRGTLGALWNELGGEGVDRLLERPEIRFSYLRQNFGTIATGAGGLQNYNYAVFEVGGQGRAHVSQEEDLERILERSLGRAQVTRKRIKRLISSMSFPRVEDDMTPDQLTAGARGDLDDATFVQDALQSVLKELLPNYRLPQNWHFRIFKLNDGSFAVDTNLNFVALNAEY
jgi:hypothetical protein